MLNIIADTFMTATRTETRKSSLDQLERHHQYLRREDEKYIETRRQLKNALMRGAW